MSTNTLNPVRMLRQENQRLKSEVHALEDEVNNLRDAFAALRNLYEVTNTITAETDVLSLVEDLLESCLSTIGSKDGSLMLLDEETNELAFVVVLGAARETLTGHRIPIGTGIAGWVAQNQENVIVPNVNVDPRFAQQVDRETSFRTHSILCVPLIHNQEMLGVIQAINKQNGYEFNEDDLTILSLVSRLAATAIAKAEELLGDEEE